MRGVSDTNEAVSVILPVYDREHLIGEALASVVAQRYPALEIVVVDDGSTDATADVVRSFDAPIRYVRQGHAGVAAARNRGLEEATGRWITFLDSDDLWLEGVLASAVTHLRTRSRPWIVHGRTEVVRLPDAGSHRARFRDDEAPVHRLLLGSMVFRRECFDRVGAFDVTMDRSEDIDWLARAEEIGIETTKLDELWLRYRVHASNITNDIPATTSSIVTSVKRALDRRRAARRP